MQNSLNSTDIKRRGLIAIEERLANGPVPILKRRRIAGIALSDVEYQRLLALRSKPYPGLSAREWARMNQPPSSPRSCSSPCSASAPVK